MTEFALRRISPDDPDAITLSHAGDIAQEEVDPQRPFKAIFQQLIVPQRMPSYAATKKAAAESKVIWPSLQLALNGGSVLDIASRREHAVEEFRRTAELLIEQEEPSTAVFDTPPLYPTISFPSGGSVEFCDVRQFYDEIVKRMSLYAVASRWEVIDGYLFIPLIRESYSAVGIQVM